MGLTFENDEARRVHFLGRLWQGLEEPHAELGGVPYAGLFDNCAVLHNRTAFEDHDEPHLKRHLMRLWLMDWDGRPTVEGVRYHKGEGGIAPQRDKERYCANRIPAIDSALRRGSPL